MPDRKLLNNELLTLIARGLEADSAYISSQMFQVIDTLDHAAGPTTCAWCCWKQAMQTQPHGTLNDWVAQVYDDVPPRMWPVAKRSLMAHLARIEGNLSLND